MQEQQEGSLDFANKQVQILESKLNQISQYDPHYPQLVADLAKAKDEANEMKKAFMMHLHYRHSSLKDKDF